MIFYRKFFLLFLVFVCEFYISFSFQISIFSEINKNNNGKNVIVSPLSIYQALSLVANGAVDKTLNEMCEVLKAKNIDSLNQINYDILDKIKEFSSLEIANAVMSKITLSDDFVLTAEKYFSSVEELKSVKQVNEWCSKKTHGKITKIINDLGGEPLLIILNAVYFKGDWIYTFDKKLVTLKPFYNLNNEDKNVQVETMTQTNSFYYYEDDHLQMVELPYWFDSISAIIILPKKEQDINDFISEMDNDNLNEIRGKLEYKKVKIELPKFEVNYEIHLSDILMDMGMVEAFCNSMGFLNLCKNGSLKIDDVIHKTYLKVTEDGTEAASVTAIVFNSTDIFPFEEEITEMKVNRPFMFILKSSFLPKNHDILFISKIEQID